MRILYIDIDSLRPDHLGCYGYHRNTSPNIDRLAADGIRFNNHHCSDAPCLPSRTALITGRFGIHTGVVGHGGTAANLRLERMNRRFQDRLNRGSLAGNLRERGGFHTAMISPFGSRHSAWWYYAGFHEIHDTGKGGMESAEDVAPVLEDWLRRNAARDQWYLHLNFWDPHTPHRTPESYGNPFADAPLPDWLDQAYIDTQRAMPGPHTIQDIAMYGNDPDPNHPRFVTDIRNMDDLRRYWDGYDTAIRYADDHVGRVLELLEAAGVLEDTAIVVSADHGENQGELGLWGEHGTADRITCRVPLIVRWPGGARGVVDDRFHYNLDLAPTLAELTGTEGDPGWDGESFAATIRDGTPAGRDEVILSQCAHVCQRSARWDRYLYMRTHHCGFHLFPDEMVFDVEADPRQEHDLAPSRPDLCREGSYRITRWHDAMMARMPDGYDTDPLWTVMQEGGPEHARPETVLRTGYLTRLEATGRAWAAAALRAKYPALR